MSGRARSGGARRGRRLPRLGVVVGMFAGLVLIGLADAGPASAHALLVSTSPADQATVDEAPATVELVFSEPVNADPGYVRVIDSNGDRVDDGVVEHPDGRGEVVSVGLDDLPDGGYIVSYRVISADSHPVSGSFNFGVGAAAPAPSEGDASTESTSNAAPADGLVSVLFATARWTAYAGAVVLVGGAVALRTSWPGGADHPRSWRLLWTGWTALVAGTVACGLLQGLYAGGRGVSSVFDLSLLDATLHTNYGRMLCARLIVAALLGVLLARARASGRPPRWLEFTWVPAAFGLALTFSASGHAVAGFAPWLSVTVAALHLLAVAVWMGGIVVVLVGLLPLGRDAEVIAGLPRFSRTAMAGVGVVAVTGAYQTWREVREWDALWGTTYGVLVLLKIAAFVVLVGLGALARARIQRRFVSPSVHRPIAAPVGRSGVDGPAGTDDEPAAEESNRLATNRRVLGWSVLAEAAVGAAVLVVVSLLVATAPARTTFSEPVDRELALSGGGSVQLTVDPARRGTNTVHLYVLDAGGALTDPDEVTVSAEQESEQVGPLDLDLTHAGTGHWIAGGTNLPVSGTWTFTVSVRSGEFDSSVASATVPLR